MAPALDFIEQCFIRNLDYTKLTHFLLSLRVSEAKQFQQKLDETTVLLRDLHEAQRERLSAKQPPNMICLLAPTAKELQLGTHSQHILQ